MKEKAGRMRSQVRRRGDMIEEAQEQDQDPDDGAVDREKVPLFRRLSTNAQRVASTKT